jgi:enamine deaminase RidA (YjgF/YER057c/UK114 family)
VTDQPAETQRRARRAFLGGALAAAAGGPLAADSPAAGQARAQRKSNAKRTGLTPEGLPPADSGYTQGILAEGERLVFVSGQGPDDLDADVETQLRQTLENIGKVLHVAGASLSHVVFLRGYFLHLARDLPVYRKVRKCYLQEPYPASSCVGVTELAVPGLQIEIEALAII